MHTGVFPFNCPACGKGYANGTLARACCAVGAACLTLRLGLPRNKIPSGYKGSGSSTLSAAVMMPAPRVAGPDFQNRARVRFP